MPSLATKYFRINNTQQFIESLDEADPTNLYVFIGYSQPWANNAEPQNVPNDVEWTDYAYRQYLLAAKKVQSADVSHVIPRYDWTSGTVYQQYQSDAIDLYGNGEGFYVLTDQDNVYKCLFNNNGAESTVKPTGTTSSPIATSDGYRWKFMYNISSADSIKFQTASFIPVKTLESDDGSAQWPIQQAASNGSIDIINVTSGGSGYRQTTGNFVSVSGTTVTLNTAASGSDDVYNGSDIFVSTGLGQGQLRQIVDYVGVSRTATINTAFTVSPNTSSTYHVAPKVSVDGDGSGCRAYANVALGEVAYINVISSGVNYAYANVSISGGGSGAVGRAELSPPGGHGKDPVGELGGYNVMINSRLVGNEANTFSTDNQFRMVGILKNPLLANGNSANAVNYDLTTRISLGNISGTFVEDENVDGLDNSARSQVVQFANTNTDGTLGVLSVTNISNGQYSLAENIESASGVTATITGIQSSDIDNDSGRLLYLQTLSEVQRQSGQIEDIKIVIVY